MEKEAFIPKLLKLIFTSFFCIFNPVFFDLEMGLVVVDDTANAVLVVVEGNEGVFAPSLAEDLGAVEGIGVKNAVYRLAGTNTVGVVGVGVAVVRFELSAPIIPFCLLSVKKNSAP